MDSEDDRPTVVLDNGTGNMKAGLSGDDAPSCVFPSCIGVPKRRRGQQKAASSDEFYVGEAAQAKRGVLKLSFPMEAGIVEDWDAMERSLTTI